MAKYFNQSLILDPTDCTGINTGSFQTAGGAYVAKQLQVSGAATFLNTTASTSTTSGAVVIQGTGGLGVGGNVNAGGYIAAAGGASITKTSADATTALFVNQLSGSSTGALLDLQLSSTSAFKVNYDGAVTTTGPINLAASKGIYIPSGAPGVVTNKLYAVGTSLYFNGTQLAAGSGMTNPMTTLGDFIVGGTAGAAQRLAGNTTAQQMTLMQTGTGSASALPLWVRNNYTIITGMDPTGATDSTAAVDAAIAALPSTGGVLVTPDPGTGHYKMNLVIMKSGVTIIGPGLTPLHATLGPRTIRPYNNSLPAIQIGNETTLVEGVVLREMCIFGNTVGTKGLVFAGGAYKCTGRDIQIAGFLTSHLEFTNDDVVPCTFNKVYNLVTTGNTTGTRGVAYIDKHVSGTGWTTANDIIGFSITHANGYLLYVDSCPNGAGSLADGCLQPATSGMSIVFDNTYSDGSNINFSNVSEDSFGVGNFSVGAIVCGVDGSAGSVADSTPINGNLLCANNLFYQAVKTTITADCSTTTMQVASATGIYPGRYVRLIGGTSAVDFFTTVASVSGTTVTLAAAPGVTYPSGSTVGFGELTGLECGGTPRSLTSGGMSFGGLYGKTGFSTRNAPLMYRGAGVGATPWVNWDLITDIGNVQWDIFSQSGSGAATWSQTGTTVTVTRTSHGANVLDWLEVSAAGSPGVNGTQQVVSVPTTGTLTFTSTVSQTASGSCTVRVMKQTVISGNFWRFPGPLRFAPTSAPATDANHGQLYFSKADNALHLVTPAGVDSALGTGGSGFSNPMTAAGDVIVGGSGGAATRLPKGVDGAVLTLVAGTPAWASSGGGTVVVTPLVPALKQGYIFFTASNDLAGISVAVGDTVVVGVEYGGALGTPSATDSLGNTYTPIGAGNYSSGAGPNSVYGFISHITVAGTATITVSNGGGTAWGAIVHVVTNCTGVLDGYAYQPAESAGTSHNSGSITTTNPNDYIFSFWAQDYASCAMTEGSTGFTLQQTHTSSILLSSMDKVLSATATVYDNMSSGSTSIIVNGFIVALKGDSTTTTTGGGSVTTGTALMDFGTNQGAASVAVTGQTGILTTSNIQATVAAVATSNKAADEIYMDPIVLSVGPPTAGTGFTVYGAALNRYTSGIYQINWSWS